MEFKQFAFLATVVLVLSACTQSPTGNVAGVPKEVVVNSTPPREVVVKPVEVRVTEPEPVSESEPVSEVVEQEPVPEVIVIVERRPIKDFVKSCVKGCHLQCDADASVACAQGTSADCKSKCGNVIVPSACSTACSFRRAGSCVQKFNQYCGAQCEAKCKSG